MSKLAILLKWAFSIVEEMFAHLSLELLLKSIELSLVSIEVIIIWLLSQVLQDLTWWVVEVSWSALGIEAFSLILGLWLTLRVEWSWWATLLGWWLTIFFSSLFFLWSLHAWLFLSWDFWVTSKVLDIIVVWHLTVGDNL